MAPVYCMPKASDHVVPPEERGCALVFAYNPPELHFCCLMDVYPNLDVVADVSPMFAMKANYGAIIQQSLDSDIGAGSHRYVMPF